MTFVRSWSGNLFACTLVYFFFFVSFFPGVMAVCSCCLFLSLLFFSFGMFNGLFRCAVQGRIWTMTGPMLFDQ